MADYRMYSDKIKYNNLRLVNQDLKNYVWILSSKDTQVQQPETGMPGKNKSGHSQRTLTLF